MGSIVKVTMPLLSTLAALVIIVHTADENYDRDYRETRRALDVEPPNYDQSWRAVDVQPVISQTIPQNQEGWNDDSPDQPIRRRRRKRKRRPQYSILDEEQSPDTYMFKNDPPALQEDNVEMTGRHRKKDNDQEAEEYNRPSYRNEQNPNKPLRRKGQRRRRPLVVDSWPELSEFNNQRQNQFDNEDRSENYKTRDDNMYKFLNINNEKGELVAPENEHIYTNEQYYDEKSILVNTSDDMLHSGNALPKDKSLSEFSSELVQPAQSSNIPIINTSDKIKDKTINIPNEISKPQDREPLDPRTLKALLKRSNGKSLSEILQQNNLSLSDLLNGKAKALSILQADDEDDVNDSIKFKLENNLSTAIAPLENIPNIVTRKHVSKEDVETNDCDTTESILNDRHNTSEVTEYRKQNDITNFTRNDSTPKVYIKHRFPVGSRRRLRMPKTNSTSQKQINRDILNLTSIKYKNSRHINKSKEWKEVLSTMMKRRQSATEVTKLESSANDNKITTSSIFEETTTEELFETTTDPSVVSINTEATFYEERDNMESDNTSDSSKSYIKSEISPPAVDIVDKETITDKVLSETPKLSPFLRPLVNSSELRRQAYSNRLKRKRLKQKDINIEEHEIKNTFSEAHLVSASEFIEKTQMKPTEPEIEEYTTSEDLITIEPVEISHAQSIKSSMKTAKVTRATTESVPITTQDSAKYEIEEILSDSITSTRLSKVLKERNMTLNELFEHRERGSSHVHLADIFHNASREPNPPEPFLSKSLIEPISREIYPLRALLEANLHDPKTTTIDTNSVSSYNLNIPVVMDFGNNVNENGENMGIISLFNNFSKINNEINVQNNNMNHGNESNDNIEKEMSTSRESRILSSDKDAITWNDLITLMQRNHQNKNDVKIETDDNSPIYENLKNIKLDEDVEGNSLMVLDDLQNLKNFDIIPTSDELLEIKLYENSEFSTENTIDSSFNTTTKSVTVATVTIIGLALILFLLTYGMLKWKQQNKVYHNKHSKEDEYIPSPVFENRKGQKMNSSTRSKSPMLSSNIYAIDSLDTRMGNESPEYMWDSLRKPFQ